MDPDSLDLAALEPYIEQVSRYVQRHLPLLEHEQPARLETCRYTVTPDNEPILDYVDENVVVGCGFSGSGFKHSPASGYALAALALKRANDLPKGFTMSRYALERF